MRTLSTTLFAVAFAHIAYAADLPSKAPSAPAAVAPNWTGFYVGLNFGYGWSPDRAAAISGNTPASQNLLDFSPGVNPFGLKVCLVPLTRFALLDRTPSRRVGLPGAALRCCPTSGFLIA